MVSILEDGNEYLAYEPYSFTNERRRVGTRLKARSFS